MNNKLKKIKKEIGAFVYSMATYISPCLNTQLRFIKLTGKTGNLKQPETFSEKLSWLKLNYYSYISLYHLMVIISASKIYLAVLSTIFTSPPSTAPLPIPISCM